MHFIFIFPDTYKLKTFAIGNVYFTISLNLMNIIFYRRNSTLKLVWNFVNYKYLIL